MSEIERDSKNDYPTDGVDENVGRPDAVKVHWYRSTLTQTIIVGIASFLAPGVYNALAATGAGGLADVNIGNASLAIAYALIVPSALMATGFLSKVGPRWTLVIGAMGYAPYSAALYCNSAFRTQWFLILGAVICGATSGLFWVSEGAIIMIYSEPDRKGRYLALWQSIYQLATILGGAINLALNVRGTTAAGLSPNTYIVFIAVNCLAPFAAYFLSNPAQVQRLDRRKVPAFPSEGFGKEIWLTLRELRDPKIIACCFLWSQCLFIPSYLSTYLARHFSTRVRSLTSLVGPVLAIIFFQIIGFTLDNKRMKTRVRLLITWTVLQLLGLATTAWLLYYNYKLEAIRPAPRFDWVDDGFAAAWVPCLIGRVVAWTNYGYNYYMAGFVFPRDADGARVSRIIATLRSAESGSAAIAFGINSIGLALVQIGWINMAFNLVIFVCGAYVLQYIWRADKAGLFDEPSGVEVEQRQAPTVEGRY